MARAHGNRFQIQVGVRPEMLERIDALSELYGISRSAFCAMAIGREVAFFEQFDGEEVSHAVLNAVYRS